MMDWIMSITFDQIILSFLTVFAIRQSMIIALPNSIAGPGGWLVDTCEGSMD